MTRIRIGQTDVAACEGDLTTMDVDVVVNAANKQLEHGGGLARALAVAGGAAVDEESRAWVAANGPLGDDDAAVTTAGRMPARHLVHTAGPIHDPASTTNEDRLRRAVTAALVAAGEVGARTVALPAISAGVYRYPLDEATAVIAATTVAWVTEHPDAFDTVLLVGREAVVVDAFAAGLRAATSTPDPGSRGGAGS